MNTRSRKNRNSTNLKEFKMEKEVGEICINIEDSQSETDSTDYKPLSQKKKTAKNKNKKAEKGKNKKLLGNKRKSNSEENSSEEEEENLNESKNKRQNKTKEFSFMMPQRIKKASDLNNSEDIKHKHDSKIKENKNGEKVKGSKDKNKDDNNEKDMISFPYEFTEKVIEALSCEFCGGIFIKPYIINENRCEHIFCLGCIIKMLGDKEIGECVKCKTQFSQHSIKYSEITDYYVNTFFPQIKEIINGNINQLNQFMETESKNYTTTEEESEITLVVVLKPYRENIPTQNKLPEIIKNHSKFKLTVKSKHENIINEIKKEIIKRLNSTLKENEIELRIQGVELSDFKTYELLKLYLDTKSENIFYYSKRPTPA
jgi:hypothetical protein